MRRIALAAAVFFATVTNLWAQAGQLPAWNLLANPSASASNARSATLNQMLNGAFGCSNNQILLRGASVWACQTIGALATLNVGTGLSSSGGNLNIANTIVAGGPTGSATVAPILTWNAQGQLTVVSSATIAPPFSAITGSLAASQLPAGVPANVLRTVSSSGNVLTTDCGDTLQLQAPITLTLPAVAGFPTTCTVNFKNTSTTRAVILSGFPTDLNVKLYPLQAGSVQIVNGAWQTAVNPGRWRLPSGTTTIFVNQSVGNDNNDGLATGAGNAMATANAAMVRISTDYDTAGNSVLVQMGANESGASGVHLGMQGLFMGTNGGSAITLDGGGFTLDGGGQPAISLFFAYGFVVQNITLQGLNCINLDHAMIRVGAGVVWGATTSHQIVALYQSKVEVGSASTIGGASSAAFVSVQQGSTALFSSSITFNLNTSFPVAFAFAKDTGVADFSGATINLNAKTITGKRCEADNNAIVISNGGAPNTFFPGNAVCTTSNGGLTL